MPTLTQPTPITLERVPAECDDLHKKHFDLGFDVVVSALVGLMKVLALRAVESITEMKKRLDGFDNRLTELEGFRDMVVQAHEAMQKAEAEKGTAPPVAAKPSTKGARKRHVAAAATPSASATAPAAVPVPANGSNT